MWRKWVFVLLACLHATSAVDPTVDYKDSTDPQYPYKIDESQYTSKSKSNAGSKTIKPGPYVEQGVDTLIEFKGKLLYDLGSKYNESYLLRLVCDQLESQISLKFPKSVGFLSECVRLYQKKEGEHIKTYVLVAFYHDALRRNMYYNNPYDFAFSILDAYNKGKKVFPDKLIEVHSVKAHNIGGTDLFIPFRAFVKDHGKFVKPDPGFFNHTSPIFRKFKHLTCSEIIEVVKRGDKKLGDNLLGCWTTDYKSGGYCLLQFSVLHFNWKNLVRDKQFVTRKGFHDYFTQVLIKGFKRYSPAYFGGLRYQSPQEGDSTSITVRGLTLKDGMKVKFTDAHRIVYHPEFVYFKKNIEAQLYKQILKGDPKLGKAIYRVELYKLFDLCKDMYGDTVLSVSQIALVEMGIPYDGKEIAYRFSQAQQKGRDAFSPENLIKTRFRTQNLVVVPKYKQYE